MRWFSRLRKRDSEQPSCPSSTRVDWLFDEQEQLFSELVHRVGASLPGKTPALVHLLATSAGEGTTSVAAAYARAVSEILKRRVLLVHESAPSHSPSFAMKSGGLVDAVISGTAWQESLYVINERLSSACLSRDSANAHEVSAQLASEQFWAPLHAEFDLIVFDGQAASSSSLALLMASRASAVLVVVEAEKTRQPVLRKLIDDLQSVRANVVGTVLNRRRFYIPDAIYERI